MALTDNLVGVWCESATSAQTDESANGETLTNNNSVGAAASSKVGTAYQFTAASSKSLTHADDASLSTGDVDFTIAAWVYLDSLTNHATIVCKREVFEYSLEYETGDAAFRFFFGQNTIPVNSSSLGSPATGTWYYVVIYHDSVGHTINITVNNATPVSASDTGASAVDGNGSFGVGQDPVFGNYWDGRINQLAFWKRVLSSAERTQLYNSGNGLAFASWAGAVPDEEFGLTYSVRTNW